MARTEKQWKQGTLGSGDCGHQIFISTAMCLETNVRCSTALTSQVEGVSEEPVGGPQKLPKAGAFGVSPKQEDKELVLLFETHP